MNEDEAKTKWCPMVRQVNHVGQSGGNRLGVGYDKMMIDHSLCIASECMWWVEDEWITTRIKGQDGHFINEPAGHCGAIK